MKTEGKEAEKREMGEIRAGFLGRALKGSF
jgi:hypothetical protein